MPPNLEVNADGTFATEAAEPEPEQALPPRREVMREFLSASPLLGRLGIGLVELGEERAVLRLPFDPANATIGDVVHGGAIATLIDTAGMAAAWSNEEVPRSLGGATSTMNVDYLAPAAGCNLIAEATVVKRSPRLCVVTVVVEAPEGEATAAGSVVHRYL